MRAGKPDPGAPSTEDSPIFIVGFPRSGTTLLEQMLDAHPGLRSMDERAFLQKVIQKMQDSGEYCATPKIGIDWALRGSARDLLGDA